MKLTISQKTFFIIWFLMITSTLFSQPKLNNSYAKPGLYIGTVLNNASISTNFDNKFIQSDFASREFLMPDVKSESGFGVVIGLRFQLSDLGSNEGAIEVVYFKTSNKTSFQNFDFEGNAKINELNLDFKYFFNLQRIMQPNIVLGLSYYKISLDNGIAIDNTNYYPPIRTANFDALGIKFGVGMSLFITPAISLNGEMALRYFGFGEVWTLDCSPCNPNAFSIPSSTKSFNGFGVYSEIGLRLSILQIFR